MSDRSTSETTSAEVARVEPKDREPFRRTQDKGHDAGYIYLREPREDFTCFTEEQFFKDGPMVLIDRDMKTGEPIGIEVLW